ncbi:hypothetical protein UlMin_026792 [Ulmus minor]
MKMVRSCQAISSHRHSIFAELPATAAPSSLTYQPPPLHLLISGWVGYFSYDTVRYVEKRKVPFSMAPKDDRNLADIHLGLYDDVLVFDHVEKKVYVIHWVRLDRYSSIETAYEDGVKYLASLLAGVQSLTPPRLSAGYIDIHTHHFRGSLENSNMTSEEYKKMVLEAKEHILEGDIFQIVLSQCFERRTFADPFEIYRALRVVNPSPYMTHLQARGCILVASSPEILTHVNKRKVVNLPLAGTTRRGKTTIQKSIILCSCSVEVVRRINNFFFLVFLQLFFVLFLMPCHATPCYSTLHSALQHPYVISRLHT